jgi:hypothetical protein
MDESTVMDAVYEGLESCTAWDIEDAHNGVMVINANGKRFEITIKEITGE